MPNLNVIGTTLGSYSIESLLGEGGMGAVYRARDTKLGRSVAIKVLPPDVAADPERIARFEREARALASLNHPRIATLFGMEHIGGRHLLVMELVEGETLSERLQNGPLSLEHALRLALQIAEGLEAAHEAGVVHRDLKPANIKITPDETIKILDFGLAKAVNPAEDKSGASAGLSNSPTLSIMATQAGMILGTAAYMSPEQAKGLAADHRSDIFSFGVVLYEMLVGRQPFKGDTAPEIIASVIVREADLDALPPTLDPRLRELLRRCLEKSPKRRWQAIGDVRHELEAIGASPRSVQTTLITAAPITSAPKPLWQRALPIAGTAAVFAALGAVAAWSLRTPAVPSASVAKFQIALPEGQALTRGPSIALSPDGKHMVYVVDGQLYVRSLDQLDARPIPGSDLDPFRPFFSPDGQWVGFYAFSDQTFKRIALAGGSAVTICNSRVPHGAVWTGDRIVFVEAGRGIMRVPANGGEPEVLVATTPPEMAEGPQMLDDDTLLFSLATEAGPNRWNTAQIVIQSLTTGQRTVVLHGGVGQYVPSGHLVYAVGGDVLAVPLDVEARTVRGSGLPVIDDVRRTTVPATQSGTQGFAVSPSGVLAYHPGFMTTFMRRSLVIVDRSGRIDPLPLAEDYYFHPRLSPDGNQLAVMIDDGTESFISVYDLRTRGLLRRLTFRGRNMFPMWTRDGRFITFSRTGSQEDEPGIYRMLADGSGTPERLFQSEPGRALSPESWSPDGKTLSYRRLETGTSSIWLFTVGDPAPKRLDDTIDVTHSNSSFSPDGRWISYNSTELTGTQRVLVQPFPTTGAKYQVVTTLSASAGWSHDGKRLFYDDGAGTERVMVGEVKTSPGFSVENVQRIEVPGMSKPDPTWRPYDIFPDGRMVAMRIPGEAAQGAARGLSINVVLNWFEELKTRVPVTP